MDRRLFRASPAGLSLLAAACVCAALGGCKPSVSERQVREDFATLQATGAVPGKARLERIERSDGWEHGADVEVYFCLPAVEGPGRGCEPRNIGLSYQNREGRWRLFSVQAEQAVE